MKIFLTNGMFGDHLCQIGGETDDAKKIIEHIYMWKQDEENKKRYKIESYDRILFNDLKNQIAIDFGDYCTFFLIENVNEQQKLQFMNV